MREIILAILIAVFGVAVGLLAGIKIWRHKNRDFRAAVVIENWRLWRELVQRYRDAHPFETYSVDVATEAAYNAVQGGPDQKVILTKAWDNVKKMTKFIVQECQEGRNVGSSEVVYANSDLEAAKTVATGCDLRRKGKLGGLRVKVRVAANPGTEALFYADPPHSN
jgi:hypothetical protein